MLIARKFVTSLNNHSMKLIFVLSLNIYKQKLAFRYQIFKFHFISLQYARNIEMSNGDT